MDLLIRCTHTTPHLVKVNPAAAYDMEEFHRAGGIPRLMERLGDLIDSTALTCTRTDGGENLKGYHYLFPDDPELIRTRRLPYGLHGVWRCFGEILAPTQPVTNAGGIWTSFTAISAERPACLTGRKQRTKLSWPGLFSQAMWWSSAMRGPKGARYAGDVQGDEIPLWSRVSRTDGLSHRRTVFRHQQWLLCGAYLPRRPPKGALSLW